MGAGMEGPALVPARARELVARFGSPLYVYDEAALRARARALRAAFEDWELLFALKSNGNPTIATLLLEEGFGFDAVSLGEVELLKAAGVPAPAICCTPNNAPDEELYALAGAGCTLVADALDQLETMARAGHASLGIRLNAGVGAGHHAHVVTGGADSKFGLDPEEVPRAVELAARQGARIEVLHQHIGSGITRGEPFAAALRALEPLSRSLPDLRAVDTGGGLGISYRPGEETLELASFSAILREGAADLQRACGRSLRFRLQPGRWVVGPCGTLLVTVTSVKERAARRWIGTDSGAHHLLRPMLYGSHHEVEALAEERGASRPASVVGTICESGDVLASDRDLPALKKGDLLALRDAGAYGYAMASTYNQRPRPAEVLIRSDGHLCLIRRRETLQDLRRLDIDPA